MGKDLFIHFCTGSNVKYLHSLFAASTSQAHNTENRSYIYIVSKYLPCVGLRVQCPTLGEKKGKHLLPINYLLIIKGKINFIVVPQFGTH
jgi:hypothetical protein